MESTEGLDEAPFRGSLRLFTRPVRDYVGSPCGNSLPVKVLAITGLITPL